MKYFPFYRSEQFITSTLQKNSQFYDTVLALDSETLGHNATKFSKARFIAECAHHIYLSAKSQELVKPIRMEETEEYKINEKESGANRKKTWTSDERDLIIRKQELKNITTLTQALLLQEATYLWEKKKKTKKDNEKLETSTKKDRIIATHSSKDVRRPVGNPLMTQSNIDRMVKKSTRSFYIPALNMTGEYRQVSKYICDINAILGTNERSLENKLNYKPNVNNQLGHIGAMANQIEILLSPEKIEIERNNKNQYRKVGTDFAYKLQNKCADFLGDFSHHQEIIDIFMSYVKEE